MIGAYDRSVLVKVIVYHQRMDDSTCACGRGKRPEQLGLSFADHIADVYEESVAVR